MLHFLSELLQRLRKNVEELSFKFDEKSNSYVKNFDLQQVSLVVWVYETDMQGVELQSSELEEVCIFVCYPANCHFARRPNHNC
jgi:uncharacterized protein YigA (DUF484 family)